MRACVHACMRACVRARAVLKPSHMIQNTQTLFHLHGRWIVYSCFSSGVSQVDVEECLVKVRSTFSALIRTVGNEPQPDHGWSFSFSSNTVASTVFSRYMTALTDSDEEEPSQGSPSQGEEVEKEEPADQLVVLLERVDALHRGDSCSKKQSLDTLLEKKEEVH